MKPKPFALFAFALYSMMGASVVAFANDVYTTSKETYGIPQCENYQFTEVGGNQPIHSSPKIYIENYKNAPVTIHYEFRMCTEDGYCGTSYANQRTIPAGGKWQHTVQLNQRVKFQKYGDYHYTVSIAISGDINEFTEKTCGIHIRKNN